MAVSRIKTSSILQGFPKSRSALAGYPPAMAAPTATASSGSASIAFTPVTGGTSYTVLSTPGSITATGSSSPIVVSGLTNGTAYTFQVRATNSVGTGGYSQPSNSITPIAPTPTVDYLVIAGGGNGGTANGDYGNAGGGGGAGVSGQGARGPAARPVCCWERGSKGARGRGSVGARERGSERGRGGEKESLMGGVRERGEDEKGRALRRK